VIGITILISTSITVLSSRRGRRHRIIADAPAHA
jgi:simple sugar transport system permease protein